MTHEHMNTYAFKCVCTHTHTQRHANKQVGTCTYEVKSYAILYTLIQKMFISNQIKFNATTYFSIL